MTTIDAAAEFDRQVRNLIEREYPAMAGLTPEHFQSLAAPLRDLAATTGNLTCVPGSLERFVAIAEAELPDQPVYLLVDIERGEEFCGAVPRDAMDTITARERTLLTSEAPHTWLDMAFAGDRRH
ncbi:DUF5701 family protein [Nonomuraea guangzhouensis]|uniref:DUF5701 family protein n=1 Tax=Nonomuraea guangzhouensis TaxID=1291555 RepID=A0ABW4GQI2_9ACTN|nr:DUF5701 family protein [Nonomuraea guangzhouensis]